MERSAETHFQELDSLLSIVERYPDPLEYFALLLRHLAPMEPSGPPGEKTHKIITAIQKRFPGVFRFVCVDGQGEILERISAPQSPRMIARRLFQALSSPLTPSDRLALLKKDWSLLQSFVGFDADVQQLKMPMSRPIEANVSANEHWFFAMTGKNGGIFVHINKTENLHSAVIRDRFRSLFPGGLPKFLKIGLWDVQENSESLSPKEMLALGEFRNTLNNHFTSGESRFSILAPSPTLLLWASRNDPTIGGTTQNRFILVLLLMAVFSLLSFLTCRVMVAGVPFVFSIRTRLSCLFLFVGGLPLLLVHFSTRDFLYQKHQAGILEAQNDAESLMRAIENDFPRFLTELEKEIREFLAKAPVEDPKGLDDFLQSARQPGQPLEHSTIQILNPTGGLENEIGISTVQPGQIRQKLIGSIVSRVLVFLNGEIPKNAAPSLIPIPFETIRETARGLGRIGTLSWGAEKHWTMLVPLKNRQASSSHMAIIQWKQADLEWSFVTSRLKGYERKLPGSRLWAMAPEYRRQFPSRMAFITRYPPFLQKIRFHHQSATRRILFQGKPSLMTGYQPTHLVETCLFVLQPEEKILLEICIWRQAMGFFSFFCCFLTLVTAFLLSRSILRPIKNLSAGVLAIHSRNFRFRVPVLERDELGRLAALFNEVMEDLADLDLAAIVQDKLLPHEEMRLGRYRASGKTVFATDIGGDFLGIKILDEYRFAIMIGDVTGHGVPAALGMAAIKALADRLLQRLSSPHQVLEEMSRQFHAMFKKKRLMTFFLGIVDTRAHLMAFANAGHCYPYLFHGSEKPRELRSLGLPLGAKKVSSFTTSTIHFDPDDRLFLYTDNLVETCVGSQQIGFERLLQDVGPLMQGTPEKICERIFHWHAALTNRSPMADDMTILVVHHEPA